MKTSVEHRVKEVECNEVSIRRTGRRTHSSGIHVKSENTYHNSTDEGASIEHGEEHLIFSFHIPTLPY